MKDEERKGKVEVDAAHQMLARAIGDYVAAATLKHYQELPSLRREVGRWESVCGYDGWPEVVRGFRCYAAEDVGSWLGYVGGAILEGNWSSALATLDGARRELLAYIELLEIEIPPEEEEAAEEVTEEVEPGPEDHRPLAEVVVEEPPVKRPWEGLGITKEKYTRLLREVLEEGGALDRQGKSEVTAVVNAVALKAGVDCRVLTVGYVLIVLDKHNWDHRYFKGIGDQRMRFLRDKLDDAGYSVPEQD